MINIRRRGGITTFPLLFFVLFGSLYTTRFFSVLFLCRDISHFIPPLWRLQQQVFPSTSYLQQSQKTCMFFFFFKRFFFFLSRLQKQKWPIRNSKFGYNRSRMLLSTLFLLKGVDFMTSLRKREKRSRPKRETGNYYSFFSSSFFFRVRSYEIILECRDCTSSLFFFLFRIEKKSERPSTWNYTPCFHYSNSFDFFLSF